MIKVTINNICAKLTECEPLTSGMIGKLVEVTFSSEWSGLNKIAVFSNGDVTKDLYESQWNGNYIPIPQEVLTTPHRTISMGVYGYELVDDEKVLAIPTIVAEIGRTKVGADPSDDPAADPTLPIWAQLQWEIDHFEIPDEQIAIQVQAYLDEHPIEIQPATASVLGGIKVGANLSITADGTLSAEGGGYEPPVGGIPKTDLASDVQASLDKADSALQAHQSLDGYATEQWVDNKGYLTEHQSLVAYRTAAAQDIIDGGKVDKVTGKGLSTNDYTNADKAKVDGALTSDDTEEAEVIELADVAISGSYNDLINKPTIPTVNDAVLTIKQGGVTKGTFSANASTSTTIDLPTKTSDLTNDSGYLTLATLPIYDGSVR